MKTYTKIVIISISFFAACSALKNNLELKAQGDYNIAVQNAISDFSRSSPLRKKDNAFFVRIENINDEILGVSILGDEDKFYPDSTNKIGTSHPNFPTRFVEIDKKLFYWYDSTHHINIDLINILAKYNKIDSLNVNGLKGIPPTMINDEKKAEQYYFCKSNLLNYKTVRTNIAMGSYAPPKLNCKNPPQSP
jgi:hypothetical protein